MAKPSWRRSRDLTYACSSLPVNHPLDLLSGISIKYPGNVTFDDGVMLEPSVVWHAYGVETR